MTRTLAFVFLAIVLQASASVLNVALSVSVPLAPALLLIAWSAMHDGLIEGALAAACVGVVVDALSGNALGVGIFAALVCFLLGHFAMQLGASAHGVSSFLLAGVVTLAFCVVAIGLWVLFGSRSEFGWKNMLATAACNTVAAPAVFALIRRIWVFLRLHDGDTSWEDRLASRGR